MVSNRRSQPVPPRGGPSADQPAGAWESTKREWSRRERDLLAGCDAEQVEAITILASPLCVLASAGSGKTRVLTRRIAWRVMTGSATAAHTLALTFTRKAAVELRTRLSGLGLPEAVTAGTFHAIALSELRREAAETGRRPPIVLSSKARMLSEVLADYRGGGGGAKWQGASWQGDSWQGDSWQGAKGQGAGTGTGRPGGIGGRGAAGGPRSGRTGLRSGRAGPLYPPQAVGDLASEIEWAKSRSLRPNDFVRAAALSGRRSAWDPNAIADIWDRYETYKSRRGVLDFEDLLCMCTDLLERDPAVAASTRWRFRHVLVDEYQDVNDAQLRLLRAWLGESGDLCVVGDPNQAIYAWNGSNPRAIAEFAADFPGATVLRLSVNYRSTTEVLTVAGAVLGEGRPAPAGGALPDGPVPTLTEYPDDEKEASAVAEAIRRCHRPGRPWSRIAVLARTNAQLAAFEEALRLRGVACRLAGAGGLLSRSSVREELHTAARCRDGHELATWAADLADRLPLALPGAASLAEAPLLTDGSAEADLRALARLANEYLAEDSWPTGAGYRTWLDTAVGTDVDPVRRDAVELMTFHRAKGLEWAVVFVTGLEDGLVPIAHARDADALAEERRLLYVACTRAAEELHCSWASRRSFGTGAPVGRSASPFVAAIVAASDDLRRLRGRAPQAARRAISESRRFLEDG